MARLRYNGLATGSSGSITALSLGGSLTSGGTTITLSAALTYGNGTAVPTIVAPDYIPLSILDTNGNLSEIVYLTAYTAAATTGTITRGQEGTTGVAQSSGAKVVHAGTVADASTKTATFKVSGVLSTGTGATRLYNDTGQTWTLSAVRATVETSPSGGAVTVDFNKNGTTVFTTQGNRPSIASAGTTNKATAIDVTTVADGDYLTVDIDVATAPAANLTVEVVYS